MRKKKQVPVLYCDRDIVVCEKPFGMPCVSDQSSDMDLVHSLKNYLFFQEKMDGEPEIYPVHRLDRPVGGVMVFARNSKAAAELSRQIREHSFEKYYQAVVSGWLPQEDGTWTDYMVSDSGKNCGRIVSKDTPGAKEAILDYEVLDMLELSYGRFSYCLIHLVTGRHHQIRVQFASRGFAIWGDTKYHPEFQKAKNKFHQIGLFCACISFVHPVTKEKMRFKREPYGDAFSLLDAEE